MSGMFKLSLIDLLKGVIVAVLFAAITYFLIVLNSPAFSFTGINWNELCRLSLISGLSYILKNLLSDSQGNVLGIGSK